MNQYNEKPTGSAQEGGNRLEKEYSSALSSGGNIQIHITAEVDSKNAETEEALHQIAVASRNFYLEFGNQLNNMR